MRGSKGYTGHWVVKMVVRKSDEGIICCMLGMVKRGERVRVVGEHEPWGRKNRINDNMNLMIRPKNMKQTNQTGYSKSVL